MFLYRCCLSVVRDDDDVVRRQRHRQAVGHSAPRRQNGGRRVLRAGRHGEAATQSDAHRESLA